MNNKKIKILTSGIAAIMCGVSAFGFAGCGDKTPAGAGDRVVVTAAISQCDADTVSAMQELVDTYNDGQGKEDNVFIDATYMNGDYIQYIQDNRKGRYGIVLGRTGDFKNYARYGIFEELDGYLTDDVKAELMCDDIPENILNMWKFNAQANSSGKYEVGRGQPQAALPFGNNPHVLFYNKAVFAKAKVNEISVSEAELENSVTYANVMPHGYAEYLNEPYEGAVKSANQAGQEVYKVFNNRIPMSWEETRHLGRELQTQANLTYGLASWWWFHYGWSVGGDCIGWDESAGQYKFTLANDAPNWLVTEDGVKLAGGEKTYKKGEVLIYEDAVRVNSDPAVKSQLESKLYQLPSQKDAIREFLCLTNASSTVIDTDEDGRRYTGYGISNPEENTGTYFNVGDMGFYVSAYYNVISQSKSNMGKDLEVAPLMQYREFEGGSVYYKTASKDFADEELKIIGKEYDGKVYTGELKKTANGTPCVGEVAGTCTGVGICMLKGYEEGKKASAFKFMKYAAGPEGQKIISKTNYYTPNQISVGMSDEVCNGENKIIKNTWAVAFQSQGIDIGDYDYFCSSVWTNRWANDFNKKLRKGGQTFAEFLRDNEANANADLQTQIFRLHRR